MEELVTIVVLVDEEGNEQEFESLGSVEYNKEIYEFFLPCNISEDDVAAPVILKLETVDEKVDYASVEDEDIVHNIFEIFKEKYKDEFDFAERSF